MHIIIQYKKYANGQDIYQIVSFYYIYVCYGLWFYIADCCSIKCDVMNLSSFQTRTRVGCNGFTRGAPYHGGALRAESRCGSDWSRALY